MNPYVVAFFVLAFVLFVWFAVVRELVNRDARGLAESTGVLVSGLRARQLADVCALPPIVDWIGDWPVIHGERDHLDPDHPEACLCGFHYYLWCPEFFTGGIATLSIGRTDDGISVDRVPSQRLPQVAPEPLGGDRPTAGKVTPEIEAGAT
jgi:hypothetical protein